MTVNGYPAIHLAMFIIAVASLAARGADGPAKTDQTVRPIESTRRQESWTVSTGPREPQLASFDQLMSRFLKEHQVPGAALAVTDHGRLVYARGFGYADLATGEKVQPTSLFRIASLSKPITAVAVLQLIEQHKLSLDDKVFDILHYSPHLTNNRSFDARHRQITIRHLLQHRGGWDRRQSFDPMFRAVEFAKQLGTAPPVGPAEIIRCMLGRRLDFDPGQRYAYSNYGYCLLGRVIETVSGMKYEAYVKRHVLAPLGIHSMRLGKTHLADRQPGEVRYYADGKGPSVFADNLGEPVPRPYGTWCLEAMDSHGGWLASAVDLARFAAAFDDPQRCQVLSAASIRQMYARPPGQAGYEADGTPKAVYYSLGWMNRVVSQGKINHWHTGSLAGTAALLVRRHDGRNWVVLMNTRTSSTTPHLGRAIDGPLHQAANAVRTWPSYDRFKM